MLRKTIIALTTLAALGGTALLPTSASAHGARFFHPHGGFFYGGPAYVVSNCYWVKKYTPFGVRLIRVCNY